jgi:aspartyl/asparaginyl beta-hydroxylase (cupin superfamily)
VDEHSWLSQGATKATLSSRLLVRILPFVERLNRACSKVSNDAVLDTSAFPWVPSLERDWRTIRAELDQVLVRKDELPGFQDILADVGSVTQDRGWKSFLLIGVGEKMSLNIAQCPQTWQILERIPGLSTAMFSIFEPGKHLEPHRGPYNGLLRLHLGLIVPDTSDNVAIRVGSRICHWDEGTALVFDDSYEHEAWNNSDQVRVVLFADFVRPLRFPANVINRILLAFALRSPFIRDARKNQRKWEAAFYGPQPRPSAALAQDEVQIPPLS